MGIQRLSYRKKFSLKSAKSATWSACRRTFCVIGKRNSRCFHRKKIVPDKGVIAVATWKSRCVSKSFFYDELYTIAGAKKKLQTELREISRLKIVHPSRAARKLYSARASAADSAGRRFRRIEAFEEEFEEAAANFAPAEETVELNSERREALKSLASQLLELREMLKVSQTADENFHQRKY